MSRNHLIDHAVLRHERLAVEEGRVHLHVVHGTAAALGRRWVEFVQYIQSNSAFTTKQNPPEMSSTTRRVACSLSLSSASIRFSRAPDSADGASPDSDPPPDDDRARREEGRAAAAATLAAGRAPMDAVAAAVAVGRNRRSILPVIEMVRSVARELYIYLEIEMENASIIITSRMIPFFSSAVIFGQREVPILIIQQASIDYAFGF